MSDISEIDWKCIGAIRGLAVDATSKANSGHPGAPMALAPFAHLLWSRFLSCNPSNSKFANRDRFVLSNGHACMLQYAMLHLMGYKVSLDMLKRFRQVATPDKPSLPGHPEAHETDGIEVTTGPLGQGFSNAVGLAIGEAQTRATFNRPGFDVIDHYTYCIFGDGCAMEGVASEAASLAGHLQLGNLICIYDDNHISIDGDTACSFTEDVTKRFEAYGWHVLHVPHGDDDLKDMEFAIKAAQSVKDKPSMIKLTTVIGFGSKLQGTGGVHGNALKDDDAKQAKAKFGLNPNETFAVLPEVYDCYKQVAKKGVEAEKKWTELMAKYKEAHPQLHADLTRRLAGKLPNGWEKALPTYKPGDSAVATRKLSEDVLTKLISVVPELIGGSADLTGSNLTRWKDAIDFQPETTRLGSYSGRYLRYGVREHGMIGAMNGIAAYGTLIPYGGTFLNFVSYGAGSLRLSALSHVRVIVVATHDSIGLGEDGPTHQPIETAAHFRALPNTMVWRPADGNETSGTYYAALKNSTRPSIICLSRQNLPQLQGSSIENTRKGGYVLQDPQDANLIIVSTGSEVSIAVDAAKLLKDIGIITRIVSLPVSLQDESRLS